MYIELAILGAFAFIYSTIVGGVEKTAITGPIVFTAFGFTINEPCDTIPSPIIVT